MSTKLGTAKVYFSKEDLGKMLKLKDKDNLMVTDVQVDNTEGKLTITITTPMDNITNDRVKTPDGTARDRSINKDKDINKLFLDDKEKDNFIKSGLSLLMRHVMILSHGEFKKAYDDANKDYFDVNKELENCVGEKLNEATQTRIRKEKHQLKIFKYAINSRSYELVVDTEIVVDIGDWIVFNYENIYKLFTKTLVLHNVITKDCENKDGIIMIDNQAVLSFEVIGNELSIDIIPSFIMDYFIYWYRKEYNDDNFNGSYEYERVCNMLKLD